ncbi:putative quinol monooxygenase [Streptomyces sp. RFCAC02]|uniref:putative quinol monooxygenase n=1 Tax=Streptomyces sp. RFCAC02 TaxID=2499143 RepID=UPI0010227F0C|nr:putative quinol monooxygenase [Streptomyces sp. RFCAC02]
MSYGYIGSMRTQPGRRDEVIGLLLRSADALKDHGCRAYVVARAAGDPDLIWVTEVWTDKEAHDASLRLPAAQESIRAAMPLLTGEFTREETEIAGGLGV